MARLAQAGSVAAAATRLRRAGRLPAPVRLPALLVRHRLRLLVAGADLDDSLAGALARLGVTRQAGPARPHGQDGPGAAVVGVLPVQQPLTREAAALRPRARLHQRVDQCGARLPAGRPATPHPPIAREPSEWVVPHPIDPRPGPGGGSVAVPPARRVPPGGSGALAAAAPPLRAAGPVRVAADPEIAALLQALVTPRDPQQQVLAPAAVRVAAAVAMPHPGAGEQAGDVPASTRRPSSAGPPSAPALPVPAPTPGAAECPAHPRPLADPPPEGVFVQAPVGLAGLASWWQERHEPQAPGVTASWAGDGRDMGPAYLPESFERWTTPPVPTADQVRDTLEQVLLEEALADGLEVTDGPA